MGDPKKKYSLAYEKTKKIEKLNQQNQKLIEALEEIASGELPDGDMPSQPVVMFAQQALDEVNKNE